MQILGIDLGSSSVKVSVLNGDTGKLVVSAFAPDNEMKINAIKDGWAEQSPEYWYKNLKIAIAKCLLSDGVLVEKIGAIGISYQMHGLVAVDRKLNVIRPSIIWCDSRAVEYGNAAFEHLGKEYCMNNLLNSPGNFTAAKLAWLKENEAENFRKIYKIMLPGDYIAMKLTGEITSTVGALSEGIFWDFKRNKLSEELMDYFGFKRDIIPDIVPAFSVQGKLSAEAADELGLIKGIPISYRSGDQPNNALSLNVLNPGEVAATAGTSGVIYGVTDKIITDKKSRVNVFAHVNHSIDQPRLGVLACINGTGIMNAWLRRITGGTTGYDQMNDLAKELTPGSEGLLVFPFGNGAERVLENRNIGASFTNLNLNIHSASHMYRAVQEGIAYSFKFAFDIMAEMGMELSVIRAGKANMFLSPLFRHLVADLTGASISLYDTDGSLGAARGAGIGAGFYSDSAEAFMGMKVLNEITPDPAKSELYDVLYSDWKSKLLEELN